MIFIYKYGFSDQSNVVNSHGRESELCRKIFLSNIMNVKNKKNQKFFVSLFIYQLCIGIMPEIDLFMSIFDCNQKYL